MCDEGTKAITKSPVEYSHVIEYFHMPFVIIEVLENLDYICGRNFAVKEILKSQASDTQTTEDIQHLKGLHKELPNGLSRAYLATLIQYHDCLLANREEKTELIEQPPR